MEMMITENHLKYYRMKTEFIWPFPKVRNILKVQMHFLII